MSAAAERFLDARRRRTPCLVIDLGEVAAAYRRVTNRFPGVRVHYSVKANPAPEIVSCLRSLGASFDVTSRSEIRLCLRLGVLPERLAYGNTVKKAADIAWSWRHGIRSFACDSLPELQKIAKHAPGSSLVVRLAVDNSGAAWPLDRKFGCSSESAVDLMRRAVALGLRPTGLSFHVGSQQTDLESWNRAAAVAARTAEGMAAAGLPVESLNFGGGLPVQYHDGIPSLEACAGTIRNALARHFGDAVPALAIEPGRYLVAAAGVIESEVVLVTRKSPADRHRWVFLDIGRFGGLAETEGDAIRYPIEACGPDEPCGPVVIAGPTCDSADILYEAADYQLPLGLAAGDRIRIRCAGAYTTVYASRFNGCPAPHSLFIGPGRHAG
ncbi:MAG: type III PLP-dependent enzyme [Rhodospirillales bacterium]|nr:type III PLP-dependent enzyme [Rhodospirillales bacterium]